MDSHGLCSGVACRVAVLGRNAKIPPPIMLTVDSPYHPRTILVPSPYLGRFMFGFRLKAKSEHEATDVSGWYGVGVELSPPIS